MCCYSAIKKDADLHRRPSVEDKVNLLLRYFDWDCPDQRSTHANTITTTATAIHVFLLFNIFFILYLTVYK